MVVGKPGIGSNERHVEIQLTLVIARTVLFMIETVPAIKLRVMHPSAGYNNGRIKYECPQQDAAMNSYRPAQLQIPLHRNSTPYLSGMTPTDLRP